MANVIKQIVKNGEYGAQTIKMILKDNERGPQGEQGPQGDAATISIGETNTLPAGSAATVQNSGTSSSAVLNFGIPKGDKGEDGEAATVRVGATTTLPAGYPVMVSNSGTQADAILNFSIPQGEQGPRGFQGPRGEKGETGTPGKDGANGKDGAPGKDGKDGKDGAIQYTAGPGINITADNEIQATGAAVATWGGIEGTLSNQTDLQSALNAKQGTLTAGTNITISGNTISATDTKYSAGTNVQISAQNVISATDTTYSAFTGTDGQTAGTSGLVPAPAATDASKYLSADGSWATPPGKTYTAGTNISISANNEISATDTTYAAFTGATSEAAGTSGLVPAPASGETSKYLKSDGSWGTVTVPTVNDSTVTVTNNGTSKGSFTTNQASASSIALDYPVITMTTTDPGEGSALAANNFIGVYGGDPIIMDYSLLEVNTGAKWIDGSAIYKKTINFGALPASGNKTVAHSVSNLAYIVDIKAMAYDTGSSRYKALNLPQGNNTDWVVIEADSTNIYAYVGSDFSDTTAYVTLYYAKSS